YSRFLFLVQQSTCLFTLYCMCVLLTGWNISSCLPSQYHYVAEPMTWTEAQTYCRETYTDLATVENIEEMKQLLSTVPSLLDEHFVWIGLYSKIEWKWTSGGECQLLIECFYKDRDTNSLSNHIKDTCYTDYSFVLFSDSISPAAALPCR
uniref:C-type lectin domain-containing protein n=1 Tax=Labrus bergylta TaxID=56723 RepID=A0A3Q3EM47_9LABR